MCIVQHVETKNVCTFQAIELPVSTNVKIAKSAATFWLFLLWTRNGQLCWLVVMVHIVLEEKQVATTRKKNHLHFSRENFPANHSQARPNLNKKSRSYSIYGIIVSTSHWLIQLFKIASTFSFYTNSVYLEATWFSQSPTTVLSGLLTLDQIQWLWR